MSASMSEIKRKADVVLNVSSVEVDQSGPRRLVRRAVQRISALAQKRGKVREARSQDSSS